MELGERLRQARIEAGLSQRQLCGDTITRNMLSQIENGSARPSMDTLRYLAAGLGKPIGYFLEDTAVTSPNQAVMAHARQAEPEGVLEALKRYQAPDAVFDAERWLLESLACLMLARQALDTGRKAYAAALLEQARQAGDRTPYYLPETERRRLVMCYEAGTLSAKAAAEQLEQDPWEGLLLAAAGLEEGKPEKSAAVLDSMEIREEGWHFLRAEVYLLQKEYALAAEHYRQAEAWNPRQVYARLEQCYRELEDYKQAYYYACKQR